jgi:hypothetical protein
MLKNITADADRKIQSRNIEISSYEYDDAHIVVCGELRDRRLVTTYGLDGMPKPAYTVHHMRIWMKVAISTLVIEDIEAELPQVPHEECVGMHKILAAIKGLTLSPGFTSKVKQKLGGSRGCIHLATLLLAMAPAALQGYWVHKDRNPAGRKISGAQLEQYLIDTCRVWRRGGPLAQKAAKLIGVTLPEAAQSDTGEKDTV